MINRTCTVIRRSESGSTDDYGNDVATETTSVTVCELQQLRRDEKEDSGEVSRDTWTVFFHADEDIETGDAVVVDGQTFELIGDPWEARNPRTGVTSHIEATARRTAGAEDAS